MKAFRGQPGIFKFPRIQERRAELEVRNLTLRFGGITALNQINLTVGTGDLIAITGPDGSGKTSLINCITGEYRPQEGQIFLNGEEITRYKTHHRAQLGISRTYQDPRLFTNMTVLSNILLARHKHCTYNILQASVFSRYVREEEVNHREVLEELIDFLEIQSIRKTHIRDISYEMRKRVEFGRALALEPRLLILDEPFTGITRDDKASMINLILELNKSWNQTIILAENDTKLAMGITEKVVVMDYGVKLAEGSPDFVKNHPRVMNNYHGDIPSRK